MDRLIVCLVLVLAALLALAPQAWSDDSPTLDEAMEQTAEPVSIAPPPQEETATPKTYIFIGSVNNHPKLKVAEKTIDRQVNKSMRALAPGFDNVRTFSDEADAFRIWTNFIGVGRTLDDHWDLFLQMGYTQGAVRTQATNVSWLLLPLRTDITFKRSSFYAGVGLGYYPWGMAQLQAYNSWKARLQNARPFVAGTLNWNYLTFDGNVKARFKPFKHGITIEDHRLWKALGTGITAGVDVPINERNAVSVNVQYNRFMAYTDDFSGPAFNVYWKHYF